jgi:FdhD protein
LTLPPDSLPTNTLPPALTPGHPLNGLGYARPVRNRQYLRLDGNHAEAMDADVAEEVPVALVYNTHPHVVMMATPADLEDFAIGFSISEEIISAPSDILDLQVVRHGQGIEVQMVIPDAPAAALASRGRQLVGRTGCGLCGVQTVTEALRPTRAAPPGVPISPDALWLAESTLFSEQKYNQATGSIHAAAWANATGELKIVREDVGRHNALDKVIGALAREGIDAATGFGVMTSRASYELIQKATVARIPLLACVSRPTGLAIRLAEASGLTLIALLRGKSANIYAHPERIRL